MNLLQFNAYRLVFDHLLHQGVGDVEVSIVAFKERKIFVELLDMRNDTAWPLRVTNLNELQLGLPDLITKLLAHRKDLETIPNKNKFELC